MNIDQAFEEFTVANRADGLSPATLKWYRSLLTPVIEQFAGCELDAITTKDLRLYVIQVRERDTRYQGAPQRPQQDGALSKESVDGHIRAIKRFFEWCAGEYSIANPAKGIRRPAKTAPEPKAIAESDFVKLFDAVKGSIAGTRDRAMLATLADTGCRLGGLLSMKLPNMDIVGRRILVREKGDKARWVYFTRYTAELLTLWMRVRNSASEALWTSTVLKRGPLSQSGVHEILKRLKARAGVTGRVNPHAFRHNFAREYIRSGGDVVTLAKLLGHSSVEVTAAYYAVFADDELQEFHDKHTPMKEWQ